MKMLSMDRALLRRRILRFNIVLGLLVFVAAFSMNISGEYSNLGELKAADTMFNLLAVGGLLYASFAWIFCVMSKPFWFPFKKLEANNRN
jgi:hypothetical protein